MYVCMFVRHAKMLGTESLVYALNLGERAKGPRTVLVIVPIFVFVPVFVLVLVVVLQQAATYSIAAVAGN